MVHGAWCMAYRAHGVWRMERMVYSVWRIVHMAYGVWRMVYDVWRMQCAALTVSVWIQHIEGASVA
jgi:hypothetical protein